MCLQIAQKCHKEIKKLISVLSLAGLGLSITPSASVAQMTFEGKPEMNGYFFEKFKGFEKKWKLVTVRFRKDTGELRFTYANDVAWTALEKGLKNYPDGAVFGKVGVKTEEDALFTSSLVPSGVRRFQLMVKDEKKHKDTGGWGYALFDSEGKTFPEDPKKMVLSCHACHAIAKDQGFIFSKIMNIATDTQNSDRAHWRKKSVQSGIYFIDINVENLPSHLRDKLPPATKSVRILQSPAQTKLNKNIFQGFLDEIKPSLIKEAMESKSPALFLSEDKKRFSLVYLNPLDTDCPEGKTAFLATMTMGQENEKYSSQRVCQ